MVLKIRIRICASDSFSNPNFGGHGVGQGGTLSLCIFIIGLMERLYSQSTAFISWGQDVSFIAYANDIVILSHFRASLIEICIPFPVSLEIEPFLSV